jgi:hypothetical protein
VTLCPGFHEFQKQSFCNRQKCQLWTRYFNLVTFKVLKCIRFLVADLEEVSVCNDKINRKHDFTAENRSLGHYVFGPNYPHWLYLKPMYCNERSYIWTRKICSTLLCKETDRMGKFQRGLAVIWGRCYDHNFLRILPIFGEKIGVFLKNQCYDQFFGKN